MLFDQIPATLAAQRRPLPDLLTQIDHARAELLPEIDRVNLQIFNFDKHRNLRRPHSNYRKGPRKRTRRRKSLREQSLRIKAKKSAVKERAADLVMVQLHRYRGFGRVATALSAPPNPFLNGR